MALSRDAWIEYMTRLQKDLRALSQEWAKRGRKGW